MTSLRTLAVVASATIIDDGPDARTYELRLVVPSTSVGVQRIVYVPTAGNDVRHLDLISPASFEPTQFHLRNERRTHGAARWSDRGAAAYA